MYSVLTRVICKGSARCYGSDAMGTVNYCRPIARWSRLREGGGAESNCAVLKLKIVQIFCRFFKEIQYNAKKFILRKFRGRI